MVASFKTVYKKLLQWKIHLRFKELSKFCKRDFPGAPLVSNILPIWGLEAIEVGLSSKYITKFVLKIERGLTHFSPVSHFYTP